ncbi:MAG: hypothetical protein ACM3JL_00390 [Nitrososphaerota archaeon]
MLVGAESAQAITVAKPDIEASVTASVKPTRLPSRGTAPVTLTVAGTITRTDATTAPSPLHAISFLLDRQLTVTTAGLPTCTVYLGAPLAYTRKHCASALLGSGTVDETDGFGAKRHSDLLFLNTRGGVRMYVAIDHPPPGEPRSTTVSFGSGRRLRIRTGAGLGATVSFRFRLGRTWRDDGRQRSYLSGRCVTGTLSNQITLSFSDGDVSEATPQRCTRASR